MKKLKNSNDNIELSDQEKEELLKNAEQKYGAFLTSLNFDWEGDPNMNETPRRVAKMWVKEISTGCYSSPPKITSFDNVNNYDGIVFEGNIDVKSLCSHHNYPFFGKAYIAYIPNKDGKIIGLSKLNRVVEFFSRRPQVQENLVMQIHDYLHDLIPDNNGIAVLIKATHTCVVLRGINHDSEMITSKLSGAFRDDPMAHTEFMDFVNKSMKI